MPVQIDLARLKSMRSETDPLADELAAHFIDRPASDMFRGALGARYAGTDDIDPHIKAWLDQHPSLPDWAEPDRMLNGSNFFAQWGVELGLGLFLSSLPLAYASHDGVQVLALTARLETDANRRVLESAQFVLDVTTPNALAPGSQGFETVRMVRLMHAGVRHLIHHDGRIPVTADPAVWPRWDPSWGEPVNQQHLIGAMLSYSSSLLHVLDKLNIRYDAAAAEDYCHLWNVVGSLLGIDPDVLPIDRAEMDRLEPIIRELNEQPSDAGKAMTDSLLRLVRSFFPIPGLNGFPVALMRLYISDPTADILGVPKANWTRVFLGPMRDMCRKVSLHEVHDRGMRGLAGWVSRRVLTGFVHFERHGDRPTFSIPDHLGNVLKVK